MAYTARLLQLVILTMDRMVFLEDGVLELAVLLALLDMLVDLVLENLLPVPLLQLQPQT
jgi:hypothetical protein